MQIALNNNSGLQLAKEVNKLSIQKINSLQDGVTLRSIQSHLINNPEPCIKTIKFILIDLAKCLNLQYNLTPQQIEQVPAMLDVEEFRPLTIEDVALCCSRIKSGFYGKFNRMDLPEFFSILRKYQDEKLTMIENDYQSQSSSQRWGERSSDQKEKDQYREALNQFIKDKSK